MSATSLIGTWIGRGVKATRMDSKSVRTYIVSFDLEDAGDTAHDVAAGILSDPPFSGRRQAVSSTTWIIDYTSHRRHLFDSIIRAFLAGGVAASGVTIFIDRVADKALVRRHDL